MPGTGWMRRLAGTTRRVAALAGLGLALAAGPAMAQSDTLTLAVMGPMSGDDAAAGQAMRDGVKLYVEQVNARGGIAGRDLAVETFDTASDPGKAPELAQEIADSGALAVIGGYYSSVSVAAADILEEEGIPAITGSATAPRLAQEHNNYFRVVPDNERQGDFIARYMDGVLEVDSAAVAFERDAYGQSLADNFSRAAGELDVSVPVWAGLDSSAADSGERLDQIADAIMAEGADTPVFLGLLGRQSADLVQRLRQRDHQGPIVGGDAVGLASFQNRVAELAGSEAERKRLSQGVYATTYFLSDVANLAGQRFVNAFNQRFDRAPEALAATNYTAAQMIGHGLQRVDVGADRIANQIELIEVLSGLTSMADSVDTPIGRLYFDEFGSAIKSSPFGRYQQGRLISAPVQLTPVAEPEARLDLEAERAAGNIVEEGDTVYYKTNVVYVGAEINDITAIRQQDEEFGVDFYIWLRHGRDLDPANLRFTNAVDPDEVALTETPVQSDRVDSTRYRAFRVEGTFRAPLDFREYPFDIQTLPIRLRHKTAPSERVRFVVDDLGLKRHLGETPTQRLRQQGALKDDHQWEIADVVLGADIAATNSTLGDPRLFEADVDTAISHSRFNVLTDIQRNAGSFAVKNLVPLVLLLLIGYATLFIIPLGPPFVARMNLIVTALLTAVFFQDQVASQLPKLGYLVAIDYLFFGVYVIFLIGAGSTIAVHLGHAYERPKLVRRLELFSQISQPVLALGIIAVMLWYYL